MPKASCTVGCALGGLTLLLAACGSGASPKQQAQTAFRSIEAGHAVKIVLTLSSPALPSGAAGPVRDLRSLVEGLRIAVLASSEGSGTLRSAGTKAGEDVTISSANNLVAELRTVDPTNFYLYLDTSNISALPLQLSASNQQRLHQAGALLGGRWFKLPRSALRSRLAARVPAATLGIPSQFSHLVSSLESAALSSSSLSSSASSAHSAAGSATTTLVKATGGLSALLKNATSSIEQIASAFGASLSNQELSLGTSGGTYSLELYTSADNVLNEVELRVTALGESASIALGISHPSVTVTAPKGATALPSSILSQL